MIPFIGTMSFVIYLTISTVTALENVELLEDARNVQFPLVQMSTKVANGIEKIETAFNSTVTIGDEDQLAFAEQFRSNVGAELLTMASL